MRRHAGILVAGLVAKRGCQNMFTRLRRQVRVQNKLARVDAELFTRSNLQSKLSARREINRGDIEAGRLDHRQPRWYQ